MHLKIFLIFILSCFSWVAAGCAPSRDFSTQPNPVAAQLKGKACEIWDDEQGIPHAKARDELTVAACFGYLHGRDRAWQMDWLRKLVQGRKAEIAGFKELRSDVFMRLLDLPSLGKKLFDGMSPRMQERFWAYALGVNLGMSEAIDAGVYEFSELGYLPEPWLPSDSITLFLLQGFDQSQRTFSIQFDQQGWVEKYGDLARHLYSERGLPWETTVLKEGEYPAGKEASAAGQDATSSELFWGGLERELGIGSNNWVIASARSKSGNAWLANDPHLGLRHPPFWHWAHLEGGNLNVIGSAVPGIPGFGTGVNRNISWGLTTSYMPSARVTAVAKAELKKARSFVPLIWIKVGFLKIPFFFKVLERTEQGNPILPINETETHKQVLQWSGFALNSSDLDGMYDLMLARSVDDADLAFQNVGVPGWNFVFADTKGSIGYRANGKIPKNTQPLAFGVPKGFDTGKEILSATEMPHLMRPKRGYIVTANNPQWPADGAYDLGFAYPKSLRAFRIEELLRATPKHDLNTNQKIQCDVYATDARFFVPELLAVMEPLVADLETPEQLALDALKSWDFVADLDCRACGVFRIWVDRIQAEFEWNDNSMYRKLTELRAKKEDEEGIRIKIHHELREALKELKLSNARSIEDFPRWGDIHRSEFTHLMGSKWFKAKPIPTPGDKHTINPGSMNGRDGKLIHSEGASERVIVEMSNPPKLYSVAAGTNKDIPNRNLDDPSSEWRKWVNCELVKRNFPVDWSQVKSKRIQL